MSRPHRATGTLLRSGGAVLAVILGTTAAAQDPGQPAQEPLTAAAIEAEIAALEANQTLEESVKTRALEAYREAVTKLKAADAHAASAQAHRELLGTGPGALTAVRDDLRAPAPAITPVIGELERRSREAVEAELAREQGRLAGIQRTVAQLTTGIETQQARPAKIREEIATATERLAQIETELKSLDEPDGIMRDARTARLRARKRARVAEIDALEQEQLVYQVRLDLLTARRDLAARDLAQLDQRTKAVAAVIADKRREEVDRARDAAELAQQAAAGKHPALVELADQTAAFGRDLTELTTQTEAANRTHQDIKTDLQRVETEHNSARQKLERVGLSDMLGDIFLEQRKNVPDVARYRRATRQYRGQIEAVRLRQFTVDERRRALSDPDGWIDQAIEQADPPIAPGERAAFRAEALALLAQQVDLLGQLDSAYNRYLTVLGELDFDKRRLAEDVYDYLAFLDEHLLWTPSAPALGVGTARELPGAAAWLIAPQNWSATVNAATASALQYKLLAVLGVVGLSLLFWSRRWTRSRLETIAARVQRRHGDSFLLTLAAFALTGLSVAPVPLLLGGISLLLVGTTQAPSFPHAVGIALAQVAGVLLILQWFRSLMGEHNVARVHFGWREPTRRVFQRTIRWLVLLGLPALFVAELANAQANEAYQNSIGRLAFIAGMVVLTVLTARSLAPGSGVLQHTIATNPDSWLSRLRMVWFPLAVLTPLAVGMLAGAGYYYTALALDHRLLATALTIAGAVLIHNLIVRWLVIARTKLAMARAREKRAAAQQAAEDDSAPEAEPVDLDIPEIDLATIKEQSLRLFKIAIVIVTVITLVGIWADVLPALGVLDRELWQSHVMVAGEEEMRSITIASVLFALLVTAVSFVGAKNLPGFLEVTLLRGLEPGSRYAFATMGQYVLIAIGLLLALQAVGVAWSHVQWLVAALGVGLGFGLQEIFANFVSGVIILVERPIRVGDTVTIGDVSGTVTRIRIRATTITDWDQKELVVPNKSFITGQLINWSLSNPVTRLVLKVGIAYGSDTELALRLMMAAAREHPKSLEEPEPAVFFVGFGDSSLDFEVRVFVKELSNRARTAILHDLHLEIDRRFREHDVVIAFPQRDVHVKTEPQQVDPAVQQARRLDPRFE